MNSEYHPQTVAKAYSTLVESGKIREDSAQLALVNRLDRLLDELGPKQRTLKSSALGWVLGKDRGANDPKGIYIHGGVGRGKSMLMDMFFELAPLKNKRRVHFNDFMADAHERIGAQRKEFSAGISREPDPIKPVGKALARSAKLLCFDEFSITDIADAMIVGRLFSVMFKQGSVVVATSNVAPDDLYMHGLNRQLFLPFIALLKERCDVVRLDAKADFRLEKIGRGEAYLSPLGTRTDTMLRSIWTSLSAGEDMHTGEIKLKGRVLKPLRAAGNCAWFSFDQLCREARGAADYLAVARHFSTVVVEGIPMMDATMRNEAKRFILLIDTLYDKGMRGIFSAAANPHALYHGSGGTEAFEFKRTASRLIEMQSAEYLARFNDGKSSGKTIS